MKSAPFRIALAFLAAISLEARGTTIVPSAFTRTFSVTFSGYDGESPLENFPALVRLSPTAVIGFSYSDFQTLDGDGVPTGADLRFTDAAGTELPFEIDTWNPEGESLVWVLVPSLSSSTTIHAYYGQADATLPASSTDGTVWANGLIGVWHMNADLADATAHSLDATSTGYAVDADGIVGAAYSTTATTGHGLTVPNYSAFGPTSATSFTASGWFCLNTTSFSDGRRIFSRKSTYTDTNGFEVFLYADGRVGARGKNKSNGYIFTGPAFSTDTWMHYAVQWSGAAVTVYLNGTALPVSSSGGAEVPTDNGKALGIGNYYSSTGGGTFPGVIDEVRLADGLLSADRVQADWATVADPTFATYGSARSTGEAEPMTVSTFAAQNVAQTSAEVSGLLLNPAGETVDVYLDWGLAADALSNTQPLGSRSASASLSWTLENILPATEYFYRFRAGTGADALLGDTLSFTTQAGEAVLGEPTSVATKTSLTASLTIESMAAGTTTVGFWIGTSAESLQCVHTFAPTTTETEYSWTVENLDPLTTYYYEFVVTGEYQGLTYTSRAAGSDTTGGMFTWVGGTGSWKTVESWDVGVVPSTPDHDVLVGSAATAPSVVTLSAQTTTQYSFGALDIAAGDKVALTKARYSGGTNQGLTVNFLAVTNAGTLALANEGGKNTQTLTVRAGGGFENGPDAALTFAGYGGYNGCNIDFWVPFDGRNDGTITLNQPLATSSGTKNYSRLHFTGTGVFVNNGQILLHVAGGANATNCAAALQFAYADAPGGCSALEGTGEIVLDRQEAVDATGGSVNIAGTRYNDANRSTHTITNGVGHTIRGTGNIGELTLANAGLVKAEGALGTLDIQHSPLNSGGKTMVNLPTGRMVAANPGGMVLGAGGTRNSRFLNQGLLEARTGSSITIRPYVTTSTSKDDKIAFTTPMDLSGTIAGGGRIVDERPIRLLDDAVLSPGDLANANGTGASTAGTLTITTNLTLSAETTLDFQFGRCVAGGYDAVVVEGGLTLAGTLRASAHGSIRPSGTYRIFTCAPGELTGDASSLAVLTTGDLHEPLITVDAAAGTVDAYFPPSETVVLLR